MSCCGATSTSGKGCTCGERTRLQGDGDATVIFAPSDGQRAVVSLVRATNGGDIDETFSLGVIDSDDPGDAEMQDWIASARPILARESIDAARSITLGPGQRLIASASSPLVTFFVSKLERTA